MAKDISELSNSELLSCTRLLIANERKLVTEILEHLKEIEVRRLYAEQGYSSMFEYCQKELGYTESEAYHRISCMRLMKHVPEVKEKLQAGSFSLSTLSLAQTVFRKDKAQFQSVEKKRELLDQFENQSRRACERMAAQIAPQALISEKEKVIAPEITELRLAVSAELLAKLKRLQDLTGKSTYSELLELLADEALGKKDPDQNPRLKLTVAPVKVELRFPNVSMKRAVQKRDQHRCTWQHPESGVRCEAKKYLQIDHIQPWSLGGQTELGNLRLLCSNHHRLVTEKTLTLKMK